MNALEKHIYTEYSVEKMIEASITPIYHRNNRYDWPTDWTRMNQLKDRMRVNIISAIRTSLIETGQLRIHQLTDVEE